MYQAGFGFPQQPENAMCFFTLSAEQGNSSAQNSLGMPNIPLA